MFARRREMKTSESEEADVEAEEGGDKEPASTGAKEFVLNSLEVLRALRREIRVDVGLLGENMRYRWRRFQSRVQAAERRYTQGAFREACDLARLVDRAQRFRTRAMTHLRPTIRCKPPWRRT